MSSTLNPSEVLNDKPVIEKAESQSTENLTSNQTDGLKEQNDTNSTKNEVSPLKRDLSEITQDDQTPAKKKSKRIDKFKEESEALLKSFGLKEGTDSEKRLTRSRTRGTPVTTPIAKPEPKKVTTGAKRGRKPASEKKSDDTAPVKPTPQKKGRGRSRKQENETPSTDVVMDNNDDEIASTEENKLVTDVSGDKLDQNDEEKTVEPVESKSNEKTTEIPVVVVTKEETNNDTKSVESTKEVEKTVKIQKEEIKVISDEESCKLLVEKTTEKNLSIPIEPLKEEKKPTTEQNESKVENNIVVPEKNDLTDQLNKTVPEVKVDQTKTGAENKLEKESIEKQEVQTA